MPRKTIIIFISVFIIVGVAIFGVYYYFGKSNTGTTNGANSETGGYKIFNPFGSGTTTTTTEPVTNNNGEVPTTNNTETPETPAVSKLHKLTDFAVAGASFFEDTRPLPIPDENTNTEPVDTNNTVVIVKPTTKKKPVKVVKPTFETVPAIKYVERATGHIYQMYLDNKLVGKVSNSTIPTIYEAIFDSKAKSVIYRYLSSDNVVTSFLATLGSANNNFLPPNIDSVALSPDKTKFFYLAKNPNGVTGSIESFDDVKRTQVFASAFTEWLPQWVTDKNVYLTTKPSWQVNGSVFNLNISNGSMVKVFGGVPGLTTLVNNNGSLILYSTSLNTGPKLGVFSVSSRSNNDINLYGLPEKCIWSTDNINIYCAIPRYVEGTEYPDAWYQGLVSFDDNFVKINSGTGAVEILVDSSSNESIDATNLFLDKKESQLFFINKKDSVLWSLDLK